MAKNKKGFVLYADQHELFNQLTDEQAGKLIKHVFEYVNDKNPTTTDPLINMAFTPIKQQLKRDLKKYEDRAERSRLNGLKGGRPKTQKTQQVKKKPKEPDTVKDTVTVIVKDIKEDRKELLFSWLKYRKEIKKPIVNESTLLALVNKLNSETLGDVQTSINQSIENGWQGLRWEHVKEVKNGYPLKKGSYEYNVELGAGLIDKNGYKL